MNMIRSVRFVSLLALVFVAGPAIPASGADLEELMSHDGLQKVSVKGIDLAYARPGATLAVYTKVSIDPVEVAFHKDWNPDKTGSRIKLSDTERENIRTGVANIVREEFVNELQAKGNYQVVDAPGPDVLRVRAIIINLYVNAPNVTPGRSRVYTVSAGEMTIVAELYDSETGEVVARVYDRRDSRKVAALTLTSSDVNTSEARAIASSWARILRARLDAAHDIGKAK